MCARPTSSIERANTVLHGTSPTPPLVANAAAALPWNGRLRWPDGPPLKSRPRGKKRASQVELYARARPLRRRSGRWRAGSNRNARRSSANGSSQHLWRLGAGRLGRSAGVHALPAGGTTSEDHSGEARCETHSLRGDGSIDLGNRHRRRCLGPNSAPAVEGAEHRLLAATLDAARAVGAGNDAAGHARQIAAPIHLHAFRCPEGVPRRQIHGRQYQGDDRRLAASFMLRGVHPVTASGVWATATPCDRCCPRQRSLPS